MSQYVRGVHGPLLMRWGQRLTVLLIAGYFGHLFRNVTSAYLPAIGALVGVLLAMAVAARVPARGALIYAYAAFVLGTVWALAVSAFQMPVAEILIAAPRLLFVLPLGYFAYSFLRGERAVQQVLTLIAIATAIGCLSVPWQLYIGHPIDWFADASERAGQVRYASLLGSLTVIGITGGLGLLAALLTPMPATLRWILAICIVGGMLLSLQKAAIVNVPLALTLYIFAQRGSIARRLRYALAACTVVVVLGVAVYRWSDNARPYVDYALAVGGGGATDADVSIGQSIADRLVSYPQIMFVTYGVSSVLAGAGVRAMSGVAGLPDYRLSENQFFDILFAGGAIYLVTLVLVLLFATRAAVRAWRTWANSDDELAAQHVRAIVAMGIFLTMNLPVTSGILFQPTTGAIFWLCIGLLGGQYGGPRRLGRS
jgi:hypothetical protein